MPSGPGERYDFFLSRRGSVAAIAREVPSHQLHPHLYRTSLQLAAARTSASLMKSVLFLCTGNYYRSRFAEELFNHHGLRAGLGWMARSRALAIENGINNVGPLSPFALKALEERGLVAKDSKRFPQQCAVIDLESADLIVALMESEHRP